MVDTKGLITNSRGDELPSHKKMFARKDGPNIKVTDSSAFRCHPSMTYTGYICLQLQQLRACVSYHAEALIFDQHRRLHADSTPNVASTQHGI